MNVPIIANSFAEIAEILVGMGYDLIGTINWNRMPVQVDGIWHAEVRHG